MSDLEALFAQGVASHQQGRLADAERVYEELLRHKPDFFNPLYLLGVIALQTGRTERAVELINQAIALNPTVAPAHANLATGLMALNRPEEAIASYDRAIALMPGVPETHYNRGIALLATGRAEEAVASADQAIALKPDHAQAYVNRGNALLALHRAAEAVASFDKAIALKPDYADAYGNRANALLVMKRPDDAIACYDAAIAIKPDSAETFYNRGVVLRDLNRREAAAASYDRAIALAPDHAEALIARCTAELPLLYMSEPEVIACRSAYEARLRAMSEAAHQGGGRVRFARDAGAGQPYYLPYQGYNDRDLQAAYGAFVCCVMSEQFPPVTLASPPASTETVRVGIVSGLFNRHSVWKIPIKGWLSQLDRLKFRLFGYHTSGRRDSETKVAEGLCERFVQGPLPIERWREEVLADAPHVLIYPEIGIDAMAAALAAQRLAPVQCNALGHPQTSGYPTLDYFLSSDRMEPPDGQDHYTERLVRLPNISVYCEPIDTPAASVDWRPFGVRDDTTLYWCCQSLFKYLPQYDQVFPRIAREVGNCQFVFIQHEVPHITALFRQRLAHAFAAMDLDADAYCVFLPRLGEREFLAAAQKCDIFLNSIGWSGFNTAMESLPGNLPIVTMAGPLMRGCHALGILRTMDVMETVADTLDDYVAIAVGLALDEPRRLTVKARIAARKGLLYRDRTCIEALERFLDRVARGES